MLQTHEAGRPGLLQPSRVSNDVLLNTPAPPQQEHPDSIHGNDKSSCWIQGHSESMRSQVQFSVKLTMKPIVSAQGPHNQDVVDALGLTLWSPLPHHGLSLGRHPSELALPPMNLMSCGHCASQ